MNFNAFNNIFNRNHFSVEYFKKFLIQSINTGDGKKKVSKTYRIKTMLKKII